jgi:hypothetical protein
MRNQNAIATTKEKGHLQAAQINNTSSDNNTKTSNSSKAQRQRILNQLRKQGTLTTLEAIQQLDVPHPAGRIMELRRMDFDIGTIWTKEFSESGELHRVAMYVLASAIAIDGGEA